MAMVVVVVIADRQYMTLLVVRVLFIIGSSSQGNRPSFTGSNMFIMAIVVVGKRHCCGVRLCCIIVQIDGMTLLARTKDKAVMRIEPCCYVGRVATHGGRSSEVWIGSDTEIGIHAGAVGAFVRVVVAALAACMQEWVGHVFWDRICRLLDDIVSLTVAVARMSMMLLVMLMATFRVLCIGSRL